MESLGEWTWPGRAAAHADFEPPAWVPAFPPRLAAATAASAHPGQWQPQRSFGQRLALGALLSGLGALLAAATIGGPANLARVVGIDRAPASDTEGLVRAWEPPPQPLPALISVSHDPAGSSVEEASFASAALAGEGSFIVYLPPGFASTTRRYPVIYLLHGRNGHATAFLEIGIQRSLDRLIAAGAIPPMIAVMIQDRAGLESWHDVGGRHSASYVVEVQELIDRMLPTINARAARAIAGNSMGGFGAMHVALANPYRFAVVESWLGYFDNLDGELRADRPILARLGLHAFLYGAESDPVAHPAEDPEFARKLRGAGVHAEGVVYPGEHSLDTIREHLDAMLLFAGRALPAAG
jgi:enterochelin esterase-like enzyme